MAEREPTIQELRNQLQASRWQLHDTMQHLEERINVPKRIKSELAAHPVKWIALALGVGIAAAVTVPRLARSGGTRTVGRFLSPVFRIGIMAALPMLIRGKLNQPRLIS